MQLALASSRSSRAALVALTLATPALVTSAAHAQQGVTFTYQMTSSGGAQGKPAPVVTATVRAAGPNMRIEFRQGSAGVPMMKPGSYILIRGSDNTFAMVNPEEKAAMKVDGEGFGMGAGRATNNALVKISQKDMKFDYQDLGAGERILGIPTRHVKIMSSGTSEVRVMGKTTTSSDETTGEAWVATKVPGVDAAALRAWTQSFGRGMRRTNADLAPRLAEYERQYGDGMALRTLMVVKGTDDRGRARTDTLRMEVTELKGERLDASLFEIPKDYQVADMRQVGASLDSAMKASGLDSLNAGKMMKDAGKESAKDAMKGALGGFLRRKKP